MSGSVYSYKKTHTTNLKVQRSNQSGISVQGVMGVTMRQESTTTVSSETVVVLPQEGEEKGGEVALRGVGVSE